MAFDQQKIDALLKRARALEEEKRHLEETLLKEFIKLSVQGARHLENGIISRRIELEEISRKLIKLGVSLKSQLA